MTIPFPWFFDSPESSNILAFGTGSSTFTIIHFPRPFPFLSFLFAFLPFFLSLFSTLPEHRLRQTPDAIGLILLADGHRDIHRILLGALRCGDRFVYLLLSAVRCRLSYCPLSAVRDFIFIRFGQVRPLHLIIIISLLSPRPALFSFSTSFQIDRTMSMKVAALTPCLLSSSHV